MAKLDAKKRNALPPSEFAGPDRSFPIPDRAHAANAKARAAQLEEQGRISKELEDRIDARANKKLRKKK